MIETDEQKFKPLHRSKRQQRQKAILGRVDAVMAVGDCKSSRSIMDAVISKYGPSRKRGMPQSTYQLGVFLGMSPRYVAEKNSNGKNIWRRIA